MSESHAARAAQTATPGHPPGADAARRPGAAHEQPQLVDADDVNRPAARREPVREPARATAAPAAGPTNAMWLLVALVMGAAIGAVTGTVAALVIFG